MRPSFFVRDLLSTRSSSTARASSFFLRQALCGPLKVSVYFDLPLDSDGQLHKRENRAVRSEIVRYCQERRQNARDSIGASSHSRPRVNFRMRSGKVKDFSCVLYTALLTCRGIQYNTYNTNMTEKSNLCANIGETHV